MFGPMRAQLWEMDPSDWSKLDSLPMEPMYKVKLWGSINGKGTRGFTYAFDQQCCVFDQQRFAFDSIINYNL